MFDVPIPGESLTTTPKNASYERPPQIVEPDKALALHLARLSDERRMDAVMQVLEQGIDIQTVTEGILRSAVAQGIHTIDTSLIIAPVIHEYIKTTADAVGIEYEEGENFTRPDTDKEQMEAGVRLARKRMDMQMPEEEPMEATIESAPEEVEAQPESKQGLMSRR